MQGMKYKKHHKKLTNQGGQQPKKHPDQTTYGEACGGEYNPKI